MISLLLFLACGGSDTPETSAPETSAPETSAPGALPNGGEVIHTAHGIEIGQEMFDAFLSALTPAQAEQANAASGRIRAASELAKNELLYREAVKRGLHQEESTKAKIQLANRELLVGVLQDQVFEEATTDQALKAYYDKHIMQFKVDSKELELIATADLATANRLKAELAAGGDFAALAQEHSVDERSKADGGKIGWVPMPSLVPEVASQIQDAEAGSVVGPISLGGAHVIFRVGESRELIPFEDVKDGIKQDPKFKASIMEDFVVSIGGEAAPSFNPALLQGLDQLPEGLELPDGHPSHDGHDHAGHNH